jgi:hypothetical protein
MRLLYCRMIRAETPESLDVMDASGVFPQPIPEHKDRYILISCLVPPLIREKVYANPNALRTALLRTRRVRQIDTSSRASTEQQTVDYLLSHPKES